MDNLNLYGISNSRVPKHSSLSSMHNFPLLNRYCHQYLSHDVYTTLKNLNSPNLRCLESSRSYFASRSSDLEHQTSVGFMSNHSSHSWSNDARMETQSSSHLPFNNTQVKLEEDVLVLDDLPANFPVDKTRSSFPPLITSSGSPSSAGKKYKTELCVCYMRNGGFCRYGAKCQFAHGEKELNPVPFSYKSVLEAPPLCKNFHHTGTCSSGSRCHFRHHETPAPPPPPPPPPTPTITPTITPPTPPPPPPPTPTLTPPPPPPPPPTPTITPTLTLPPPPPPPPPTPTLTPAPEPAPEPASTTQVKQDEPTNNTMNLKSSNWSPIDDDIKIDQMKEDFEPFINKVLYDPGKKDRLPEFTNICPE